MLGIHDGSAMLCCRICRLRVHRRWLLKLCRQRPPTVAEYFRGSAAVASVRALVIYGKRMVGEMRRKVTAPSQRMQDGATLDGSRVAKAIALLASPIENEALAAIGALRRALATARLDFNDFAKLIGDA